MLLNIDANAKTVKGQSKGYMTGILYLAPHQESGEMNVCANASPGCIATCLFTAGRGQMPAVRQARIRKTLEFKRDPAFFVDTLVKEITSLARRAAKRNLIPVVRLNGTSDLPWEVIKGSKGETLLQAFPDIQFYDYTKSYVRMGKYQVAAMPPNYHLTFSRSECNGYEAHIVIRSGGNVAVPFMVKRGEALPEEWAGYKVIDGDKHDLRFLDPRGLPGVVVGLRAKGKARKDTTGFVVQP